MFRVQLNIAKLHFFKLTFAQNLRTN